jgi:hypothetical protein
MSAKIYRALLDLDAALAAAGVPRMSAFWRREAKRFYLHPTAKLLVECVGRGGDKSRTSVKMAIAETLADCEPVPPGERHYFTHISENVSEASKTAGILESYLRTLAVPFARAGDTIELQGLPRGFKILACRVGAVSGWRAYGWTADENSKWSNDGSDPSAEVIASIRAMTVTHPRARGRMFSSPLGITGHFHETWSKGDTAAQLAGHAATWISNDSVTEEQTRALEPDPRVWSREYAAIPQAGALAAFDPDDVALAFEPRPGGTSIGGKVCIIDASSGRKDRFTFGICGFVRGAGPAVEPNLLELHPPRPGHEPTEADLQAMVMTILEHASAERSEASGDAFLRFDVVDGFEPEMARGLGSSGVVRRIAQIAKKHGATVVHADQREGFSLASAFRAQGLRYRQHDWTATSKPAGIEIVRRWFRERAIVLPEHEKLRRELALFEERINASGSFTFGARGNGHDDFVSLLITAALANLEGGLRGPSNGGGPRPQVPEIHLYRSLAEF